MQGLDTMVEGVMYKYRLVRNSWIVSTSGLIIWITLPSESEPTPPCLQIPSEDRAAALPPRVPFEE